MKRKGTKGPLTSGHRRLFDVVHASGERIQRWMRRMIELKVSGRDVVIAILMVDDEFALRLAQAAIGERHMADWLKYRRLGQEPMSVGLLPREAVQLLFDEFNAVCAKALRNMGNQTAIVAVGYGAAAVFGVRKDLMQS